MASIRLLLADSQIEGKGLFASGNIPQFEVIAPALVSKLRTPAGTIY
jgi:hypothetical protein